jgi:2-amino-4-hydroxy-6-hydroxymethyldihydropteridine diphosphokinase
MRVGVGIGTNLGDKRKNIENAFLFLASIGSNVVRSSLYETSPVDCPPDSDAFWNAVMELDWDRNAEDFLNVINDFEFTQGRHRTPLKNEPRGIDLDFLFADDLVLSTKSLILPHPRMIERRFVMEPLSEVDPDRILPHTHRTIMDHAIDLQKNAKDQACRKIV